MKYTMAWIALVCAGLWGGSVAGQSVGSYEPPAGVEALVVFAAPPLRLADDGVGEPMAELAPAEIAAADRVAALRAWNSAGGEPRRIGIHRELPLAEAVVLQDGVPSGKAGMPGRVERSPAGATVWGGEIRVEGAPRLRLRLADLSLPAGTRIWVWGTAEGPIGPFGLELAADGALWTPSVDGPAIRIEVEVPGTARRAAFRVDRVAEILATALPKSADGASAPLVTACLLDAQCFGQPQFAGIELARKAVAHLQFDSDDPGFVSVCTGTLLNDVAQTATPFLLTANHCFSSQSKASSLEAFWDYTTAACGGAVPDLGTLPRSQGATLLATGAASDFTLVRLGSIPANRAFLGWDATSGAVATGTTLHRVHHPVPGGVIVPQSYTSYRFLGTTFGQRCGSSDDPTRFHHSRFLSGGSFGGSSGSALMKGNGQIVGQLSGSCGPDPSEGCDYRNEELDGALSASFPALAPFLTAPPPDTSPCVAGPSTMCLNAGRHEAKLTFRTSDGGPQAAKVAAAGTASSGLFYYVNPNNWEMLLKVLNGCPVNNRWWIFYAATTNVELSLTVRDTTTGETKTYTNPLNRAAPPVQDTSAFATCP